MRQVENVIYADEGKEFRRIIDGQPYGTEIVLGYTYYIGGVLQDPPHKDVPEDFAEWAIDPVITEINVEDLQDTKTELDIEKQNMRVKINTYDTSDKVNVFYYNDVPFWLDKSTRVGLVNSTNMEKLMGRTSTTLILGEVEVELSCDVLLMMLAQLEVYAKDCYNVTARHLNAVNELETIEEVLNYNYTEGYPEKIKFNS